MRIPLPPPLLSTRTVPDAAADPLPSVWWRAIPSHFYGGSLRHKHTTSSTRFNPGTTHSPAFPLLYFADDPVVALLEVSALVGHPWIPGGMLGSILTHPAGAFSLVSVTVSLSPVVDLTDPGNRAAFDSNPQELTGDWKGFDLRSARVPLPPLGISVSAPTGRAPTQDLGHALAQVPGAEGFLTYSARVGYRRILALFPTRLDPSSTPNASDGDTLT